MKNSCIVIEGPDGSGKSTLARKLQEMGYEYKHFGPVKEPYKAYSEALDAAADPEYEERWGEVVQKLKPKRTVFDRMWPSEDVYGEVLRDGSRLDYNHTSSLEQKAKENFWSFLLIICLPPLSVVQSNVMSRKDSDDMEGVRENVKDLWWAYRNYRSDVSTEYYDYTSNDLEIAEVDLHGVQNSGKYWIKLNDVVLGNGSKQEVNRIINLK